MSLKLTPTSGDYLVIDSYSCWGSNNNNRVRVATVSDNQTTPFSYKVNEIVTTGSFVNTKLNEEIWTGKFTGSKTDNITITWAGTGSAFSVNRFVVVAYMNVNASATTNISNATSTSLSSALTFPASKNGAWIVGGAINSFFTSGLNTASATVSPGSGQVQRASFTQGGTSQAGGVFACTGDLQDKDDFSVRNHSFTESFGVSTRWVQIATELIPNGSVIVPQASNSGPCTYFVQKTATKYVVTAKVDIGPMLVGSNVSTPIANDFGAFFQPFVRNETNRGAGWNCFDNGEFDITGSSVCNITGAGQSCGLWMKGSGIFFSCAGYQAPTFGAPVAAFETPCFMKYTGASQITCILCWGQANASIEYQTGGLNAFTLDGNGFAKDCVLTGDTQAFTMSRSAAFNCINNELHMIALEGGGISNDLIEANTFGATSGSITTGNGIFMDTGIAQTWVIDNFFIITNGDAIIAAGGVAGNTNLIQSNHIENCHQGTGGGYKAGTCIFDADNFDTIAYNQLTIQADYNCIYATGAGVTINNNTCLQPNTLNFGDGSCIFVESSPNTMAITNNICQNPGGGGSGNMKYGIDCFACGTGITITSNTIIGASISAINFFNGASEGIANVLARDNSGYNAVGKIVNFVCTTCAVNAWAPVGTTNVIAASTTYTIAFVDQYWTCALNAAAGVSITITDPSGNTVESGLTCTAGIIPGAMQPIFTPIGFRVNFGAFVGGPPLVFDFGN